MKNLARLARNLASSNKDRRLDAAKIIGDWLLGDIRLSWWHLDWWYNEEFNQFLERFNERRGFNSHRRWMLWQLLRLTEKIPGHTAECGTGGGASSWLITAANRSRLDGVVHHMFDSFEGLSKPGEEDGEYWEAGVFAFSEAEIARRLAPLNGNVAFHKGWIPDRFGDVADRTFSFVHVDVDLYQPTLDSVAFFYPRLSPGAILLCDDYACSTCPGATKAVDDFLADKPEKVLALDAGGGFFIKGIETAPAGRPNV